MREPSQVFILLETVYRAFDQIAKNRNVFKVETVVRLQSQVREELMLGPRPYVWSTVLGIQKSDRSRENLLISGWSDNW